MNLTGQWKGIITFGPEYGDWEDKELYFSMDLRQTGLIIEGTAVDTGGVGCNPDIADIKGFVDGDSISFRKQYRSTVTEDENGIEIVEKGKPSPEVEYIGTIDRSFDKIEGEWQINVAVQKLKDAWLDETWTGQWEMSRT
ncbi:MAG: hypothetical protein JNK73_04055 [Bacteroidia bacterium]|nr:hypothetical protein [Bacteroidia bacterium]